MNSWEEAFALFRPGWYLSVVATGRWAVLVQREDTMMGLATPNGYVWDVIGTGDSPQEALQDAHETEPA